MSAVRVRRLVGWLSLALGVAVLGWFAWQMWGTTWTSERRQREIVADVERQWASGSEEARVDEGPVTALVRIPRFGEEYVVPLVDGTSDAALAAGFGRDTDGAEPGRRGNLVLVGHRITHGEPLRRMPDLEPGDEVVVETARATYTYVLDTGGEDLVVRFDDTWVLDERPVNPDPGGVSPSDAARLITLATCAELFATDDRMVAFGHLVDREPRP